MLLQRLSRSSSVWRRLEQRSNFSKLGSTFNQGVTKQQQQTEDSSHLTNRLRFSFNNLTKHIRPRPDVVNHHTRDVGLFNIKELATASGFDETRRRAEVRVNELTDEILNDDMDMDKRRKLVEIFDDISNELCRVADAAEFVRSSHPNSAYRACADETYASISSIVERLNTNRDLYMRLRRSYENDARLDECDRRVCRLLLADFELSGIHLDESARQKFVRVNDELVAVLMKFQIGSQESSIVALNDVEKKFRNTAKRLNVDPIKIDTNFVASEDELLREFVYLTYLGPNPTQETYFHKILKKRNEIAQLCGFETYSHRANANMILQTPERIMSFLRECSQSIEAKANAEFELMRKFKRDELKSTSELMPWDVPFIMGRVKAKLFDVDKSQYMPYFSIGSCMEGINMILHNVFNVNLEIQDCEPGELWSRDVYKLAVKDANQSLLGFIYCDFYQRENKFSNVDCHFTIQCSKKLAADDSYQLPIVVLHLNFPSPLSDGKPTLLTFEMMENLFHEFGHAMHSMFAKTRYQHVSGTRCSTDLAEVPSQLMEHYCRDVRTLKLFARHYATMESIDSGVVEKLVASKKIFNASDMQVQIYNSALDQAFHLLTETDAKSFCPHQIMKEYAKEFLSLPYVKNTHWHLRFNHLVGYGAKYYSYLVSKAIASRIWTECFEKDPLSSRAGETYRKQFLEFGGEKKPEELIKSLIKHGVDPKLMVKSLTKDFE